MASNVVHRNMFRAGRNKPITKASVKEHVHDYCSKTSIHGIKYVGERDRPRAERLWWTVMLVLAASGSGYNIHKIWRKWTTSPVIVTFAERSTPVWQVPFPAVTICPQVKSRATIFNFTDVYSKLVSGTELPTVNRTLLSDAAKVSLVCTPKVEVKNSTEETVDESVIDFLIKVAPKLEDALNLCKWNNLNIKCEKIFKPLMTEEGICYTFNLLEPFTTYG
ncbi:hypothetical protein AAG570_003096 [Ranatra chinensis]|uniref:Pickpocket protein 28-like n=1 Tax=Ranatra chinensis TaxID=642074 RepID=A0ABD0Y6X4_9HEMI